MSGRLFSCGPLAHQKCLQLVWLSPSPSDLPLVWRTVVVWGRLCVNRHPPHTHNWMCVVVCMFACAHVHVHLRQLSTLCMVPFQFSFNVHLKSRHLIPGHHCSAVRHRPRSQHANTPPHTNTPTHTYTHAHTNTHPHSMQLPQV